MWRRLSRREKLLLLVLLGVGAGYLLWRFVAAPQAAAYTRLRTELMQAREQLTRAEKTAASLPAETAALARAREALAGVASYFNIEPREGGVLVHVGLEALRHGVTITLFRPGPIVEQKYHLELPVTFGVRGNYRRLQDFLLSMEALPDLTEIRRLEVTALSSGEGDKEGAYPPGTVAASFDLVIFSTKDPKGRIRLEEILRWAVGRYNAFVPAGFVVPWPAAGGGVEAGGPTHDGATTRTGVYGEAYLPPK